MLSVYRTVDNFSSNGSPPAGKHHVKAKIEKPAQSPQVVGLKATTAALEEVHGKTMGDIAFAKREVAYGKLGASEASEFVRLSRLVMLPVMEMSSMAEIIDHVAERRGWSVVCGDTKEKQKTSGKMKEKEKNEWSEIMRSLHHPFETLTSALIDGLQHALYVLELGERHKKEKSESATKPTTEILHSEVLITYTGFGRHVCRECHASMKQS